MYSSEPYIKVRHFPVNVSLPGIDLFVFLVIHTGLLAAIVPVPSIVTNVIFRTILRPDAIPAQRQQQEEVRTLA